MLALAFRFTRVYNIEGYAAMEARWYAVQRLIALEDKTR
jgi:hypothetical protein